jgi:protein arginine N-methyltransferase 1
VGTNSVYSVADYGAMIFDRVRTGAYVRAMRNALRPGMVVIDIGTGTGFFALVACRLGARRVYAIEPEDVIQVAREHAVDNGCADRIEFIQALSTGVSLRERGDLLVSDLGGALPWFRQHIPSIVDARRRLLAPGAVLIPRRDVAWSAVVDVGQLYARWTGPWDRYGFDFDMDAARRIVTNTTTRVDVGVEHLLTAVERWGALDYNTVEDAGVRARLAWTVSRAGMGHGIATGFDRSLADGICFTNAPDAAEDLRPTIYPTLFFPWPEALPLMAGDEVTVDIEGRFVRREYIWRWKTRVVRDSQEKASFSQSTFFGVPLSPQTLRRGICKKSGD